MSPNQNPNSGRTILYLLLPKIEEWQSVLTEVIVGAATPSLTTPVPQQVVQQPYS